VGNDRIRDDLSLPNDIPVEFRATAAATVEAVDFSERIISLIAAPYGQRAAIMHRGRPMEEEIEPGAFRGVEEASSHVTANRDHDYARTIGKVIGYRHDDPRGLIADIRVSRTTLGDETLQLAADGVLRSSVGMLVRRTDEIVANGLRRVKRAFLDHIALVPNPAYLGAEVLGVRESLEVEAKPAPETPNLDAVLQDPIIMAALEGRRA
jgi:HK97 family phage prohead protease